MSDNRPLFLEHASYRRRRLGDAARVLPVLSLISQLLPIWWMPERLSYAVGALWLLGVWAVMISMIAALHVALSRAERAAAEAATPRETLTGSEAVDAG